MTADDTTREVKILVSKDHAGFRTWLRRLFRKDNIKPSVKYSRYISGNAFLAISNGLTSEEQTKVKQFLATSWSVFHYGKEPIESIVK